MTLADLVDRLDHAGIRLSVRLMVDAPAGAVTDELRAALLAHKPALIERLNGPPHAPWAGPIASAPAPADAAGPPMIPHPRLPGVWIAQGSEDDAFNLLADAGLDGGPP